MQAEHLPIALATARMLPADDFDNHMAHKRRLTHLIRATIADLQQT
jgi:hypothetical protein